MSTLQALTLQRVNAVQQGKQAEAMQIQAVQEDIDNKIQELELLLELTSWVSTTYGASPPDSGRNPLRLKDLGLNEAVSPLAVWVTAL